MPKSVKNNSWKAVGKLALLFFMFYVHVINFIGNVFTKKKKKTV